MDAPQRYWRGASFFVMAVSRRPLLASTAQGALINWLVVLLTRGRQNVKICCFMPSVLCRCWWAAARATGL